MPRAMPAALTTALVIPTPVASWFGLRSSIAALAALKAAPVANPWRPRATNSHATDAANR